MGKRESAKLITDMAVTVIAQRICEDTDPMLDKAIDIIRNPETLEDVFKEV